MTRPPPSSTLFPYTTLFRSASGPPPGGGRDARSPRSAHRSRPPLLRTGAVSRIPAARLDRVVARAGIRETAPVRRRSEEHTSELQSHVNLVCRLLLEKKKKCEEQRLCVLFGGQSADVEEQRAILGSAESRARGVVTRPQQQAVRVRPERDWGSVSQAP